MATEHSMGDLQVSIPDTIRIADDSRTSVRFGEVGTLPTEENGVSTQDGPASVLMRRETFAAGR